jgi:hypothetical protein
MTLWRAATPLRDEGMHAETCAQRDSARHVQETRPMLFRRLLPAALLATALAATPAIAQDPSFRLNNRSGTTINEVYVSSSASGSWGSDLLGANVLNSGQTLNIRIPSGRCMNDIRVVYANGRPQEWRQQNTCQITDFNVN